MVRAAGPGFRVLRHGGFGRYLAARVLGTLAQQMLVVAVGWQVYERTRAPLDLGLIGLSQFLPFIVLILPAGHAADHYDRRRIAAACFALQAGGAMLLALYTRVGASQVWPVFAIMSLFGIARAFSMPAAQALLPNVVPVESYGHAVALNSSAMQVARIAGPALGGLLYFAGAHAVYVTVALLLSAALALMLAARLVSGAAQGRAPLSWRNLLSGLAFVRSRPVILGAISMDLFAVLFGGATALLPAYAADILHVGPAGLGFLRTASGLGAALCGVTLALRPIQRRVGRWMFGGVALFGVATVVFGVSTLLWLSLAALFVLGAADMVSVYVRNLLVQLATPDAIRGRVSAVNAVFIGASNEVGEFESGVTAAWWGVVPAVVVGGVATVLVAWSWTRFFPDLWRMGRFPEPKR
ncbi:MAG TPA: MFS transporter [Burkholderiales bacterium]|nr:MFS transporter [Burkholderiales bacterium]